MTISYLACPHKKGSYLLRFKNIQNQQINSLKIFFIVYSRFVEKGNLEILLFTLQSKMRANYQKPYFPKEGKMISDINRAWERLEKAEHERELALREELIR